MRVAREIGRNPEKEDECWNKGKKEIEGLKKDWETGKATDRETYPHTLTDRQTDIQLERKTDRQMNRYR